MWIHADAGKLIKDGVGDLEKPPQWQHGENSHGDGHC